MVFILVSLALVISGADGKLFSRDGIKFEGQKGPCRFQYNEPCYSEKWIKYYLFTRTYFDKPQLLNLRTTQPPPNYNSTRPLKVLIHGFSSKSFLEGVLSAGISNVLLVDWEPLANRPCYFTATFNTWQVGKCTGLAIQHLAPLSHVHVIGFSLGAHVAGYASNYLDEHYGRKINRITGLDPALPLFATPAVEMKLDQGDAEFVDVIHTSGGIYGKLEPCGHQDFYVNFSPIQPGCPNHTNPALCSHWRASQIFAESIRTPTGFWATPCYSFWYYIAGYCSIDDSTERTQMGEHADSKTKGIFVIKTNDSPPFAIGRNENVL